MIELKDVVVVQNGSRLFSKFSWSTNSDDCWLVNGRNGSGKTLLLQLIAGVLHPYQGTVSYDFVDGTTWDERYLQRKENIVYIAAHAMHEFLEGYNDLYYQQRYYSIGDELVPTVEQILGEAVNTLRETELPPNFSIVDLLPLPVTRLSNGQLKKILLVKNFVKGVPRVMLLDYPFEGLDHASREDLCNFIDFLHEHHGLQVIIADHHHHLPRCINKRLLLDDLSIKEISAFVPNKSLQEKKVLSKKISSPSGEEIIRIKDLNIQYGEKMIIKNFNWTIHKGERWALVGRNGSGKTTLFSIIFADHPQAYAHDVSLFGRRRGTGESIWDIKRRINYLGPEQISYLNANSFYQSGIEFLQTQNRNVILDNIRSLAVLLDAEDVLKKQIRVLSSGELQLLMIVNCFLSDKELWLLDEPFQFLDDDKKERVSNYLNAHLSKEVTAIMITHYDHDRLRWTDHWMQL